MLQTLRRFIVVIAALPLVGTPAQAQRSPIVDVMLRARTALNDFRFAEADSLSTLVLTAFDRQLNRQQRIEALSIAAAARFPDAVEGAVQRRESALEALRQLVRLDPEIRLREDLSWSGLDVLLDEARASTFVPRAAHVAQSSLPSGQVQNVVTGTSTLPARWTWRLTPDSGAAPVLQDSSGPALTATVPLRFTLGEEASSIRDGSYRLLVTARNVSARTDSATWAYRVIVSAPVLERVPVPAALDPATLLPEVAPRARTRGVVAGLIAGAVTIAGTSAIRASSDLSSAVSVDSRSVMVGVLIALGAGTAGFLDKGQALPENAAANLQARTQRTNEIQAAIAENRRRNESYRATVTVEAIP